MDNKTFFDKLDALAIMAMHFNENNQAEETDVVPELAWNEFFSFVVVKCFLKERITNGIVEENIIGALESLYEKPEFGTLETTCAGAQRLFAEIELNSKWLCPPNTTAAPLMPAAELFKVPVATPPLFSAQPW